MVHTTTFLAKHYTYTNITFSWLFWYCFYFSENPRSPSLLDKLEVTLFVRLDLNDSLKLLWTLADKGTSNAAEASFEESFLLDELLRGLLEYLELALFDAPYWGPCCDGIVWTGESELEVVGACTSTLNFAVAVTFVTWELGVEHLDELPEF